MTNPIAEFLRVLNENELSSTLRGIPEEFEHGDELLAEIHEEGEIPDDMWIHTINGISRQFEMKSHLDSLFMGFKTAFIDKDYLKNDVNKKAIAKEISNIKAELIKVKQQLRPMRDLDLNALIDCKISYCDKAIEFIDLDVTVNLTPALPFTIVSL